MGGITAVAENRKACAEEMIEPGALFTLRYFRLQQPATHDGIFPQAALAAAETDKGDME
mgnify:CR=1 FL=1